MMPDIDSIQPLSLKSRLQTNQPLTLLDVREPDEREYCWIKTPASVVDLHIPMREIPARLAEIREGSKDRPLVVYCHHGVRSMMAATWLEAQGVSPVLNLDGGIDAWSIEVDRSVPRY